MPTKDSKFKVIWNNTINIKYIRRKPGDIFTADKNNNEIKKLVQNSYIEEI